MSAIVTDLGTLLVRLRDGTSLRAQLARASVWMLAGTAIQHLFAMLASIGAARILGPAEFGALGVVRSTSFVFASLAGSGLGIAASRYVAALRSEDPSRAGRVIGLIFAIAWSVGGAATIVCVVLARPIAEHAFLAPQLAVPIALSALVILFMIVGGVHVGTLTGFERFGTAASLIAAEGILTAVLMVVGAWLGGVTGAVAGHVIGAGVVFVAKQERMSAAFRSASIRLTTIGIRGELPLIGSFVIPAILFGVATQPADWLARVMLARGPNGLAEAGIFTAAFAWAQLVLFVPGQVAGPAMPMLTKLFASGDHEAFRKLMLHSMKIVLGVSVAVAVPLAALSPWIMRAYGKSFAGGAPALAFLALAYAIGAVTMVFRASLLSSGNAWLQNGHVAVWGVVLIGTFVPMRGYGAAGLSMSYAVAFAVLVCIQSMSFVRAVARAREGAKA